MGAMLKPSVLLVVLIHAASGDDCSKCISGWSYAHGLICDGFRQYECPREKACESAEKATIGTDCGIHPKGSLWAVGYHMQRNSGSICPKDSVNSSLGEGQMAAYGNQMISVPQFSPAVSSASIAK